MGTAIESGHTSELSIAGLHEDLQAIATTLDKLAPQAPPTTGELRWWASQRWYAKMLRTFVAAFVAVFVPAVTGLIGDVFVSGKSPDITALKSFLLATTLAALAAAIRGVGSWVTGGIK
jgi:hypothetical protein